MPPLAFPPRMRYLAGRIAWTTAALGLVALAGDSACAEDVYALAARAGESYRASLDELAAWCDQKGLAAEAQKTRLWRKPHDPNKVYVTILPERLGSLDPPKDAAEEPRQWHERFVRLRQDQAKAIWGLAQRAVRQKCVSLAVELAMAAIHEDPDNEAVRHLLGYQPYEGGWHTAYEVRRLRSGYVWSERFGRVRKADLPRYEAGERPYQGRWISADEDARLHRDIQSGWLVQTEHYTIRTNHSIEAGVELGTKLEQLYRVWGQLFIHYYTTESQLAVLLEGRNRTRPTAPRQHQVVYFRDRDDYNRSLAPAFPNIEISVGMYSDQTSRAYFFAGKDHDPRTLYHEATHQLFHESRPVAPEVGRAANFWIVEGIALYMESLRQEDGYYVLGGFDDLRMQAARYRLLQDGFYVPLAQLTGYGLATLQTDPQIATLYSQMAGLAHFLVHGHGGRHRDALVRYVTAVYQGSQDPALLSRLTGTSYGELDTQYRQFMTRGDQTDAR